MINKFFAVFVFLSVITVSAGAYTENDADRLSVDNRKQSGFSASDLVYLRQEALEKKIEDRDEKKIPFKLVDLRLEADYRLGHIPGAVNIPLGRKLRFMGEQMLAKSDDIVFYGYSRGELAAVNAVILFINKGFEHVSLLEGGIEEWKGKRE